MAKRGNPNWSSGYFPITRPAATEFETRVRDLGLTMNNCAESVKLRNWCEANHHRCFIPEWLLKAWGIPIDSDVA